MLKLNTSTRWIQEAAHFISAALFAFMFITFIIQVAARYLFATPLGWTSELIMIIFLWAFYWAAAFSVPIRGHISLDIIYNVLPAQGRRVATFVSMSAVAVVFALALPATIDYVTYMMRVPTGALQLPYGLVYACFPMFMIAFGIRALIRAVLMLTPNWRSHLGPMRGEEVTE